MQLENTPVHRSLLPILILECSEDQSRFRGTMKIRVRYFLSMRHKAAIVTLYTLEDTVLWYELGVMSGLRCQMTKGQRWQKFLVVVVSRHPADAASQREGLRAIMRFCPPLSELMIPVRRHFQNICLILLIMLNLARNRSMLPLLCCFHLHP